MNQCPKKNHVGKIDPESLGFIKGYLMMLGLLGLYAYAPKVVAAILRLVAH